MRLDITNSECGYESNMSFNSLLLLSIIPFTIFDIFLSLNLPLQMNGVNNSTQPLSDFINLVAALKIADPSTMTIEQVLGRACASLVSTSSASTSVSVSQGLNHSTSIAPHETSPLRQCFDLVVALFRDQSKVSCFGARLTCVANLIDVCSLEVLPSLLKVSADRFMFDMNLVGGVSVVLSAMKPLLIERLSALISHHSRVSPYTIEFFMNEMQTVLGAACDMTISSYPPQVKTYSLVINVFPDECVRVAMLQSFPANGDIIDEVAFSLMHANVKYIFSFRINAVTLTAYQYSRLGADKERYRTLICALDQQVVVKERERYNDSTISLLTPGEIGALMSRDNEAVKSLCEKIITNKM